MAWQILQTFHYFSDFQIWKLRIVNISKSKKYVSVPFWRCRKKVGREKEALILHRTHILNDSDIWGHVWRRSDMWLQLGIPKVALKIKWSKPQHELCSLVRDPGCVLQLLAQAEVYVAMTSLLFSSPLARLKVTPLQVQSRCILTHCVALGRSQNTCELPFSHLQNGANVT